MLLALGVLVATLSSGLAAPAPMTAPPADEPDTIEVAVHVVAPFVELDDEGDLSGFSIDLMNAIAEKAGWEVEFVMVDHVQAQLAAVESGEVDAAIGAISITSGREERVDFSQPMFESGIQIAAPASPPRSSSALSDLWARFTTGPLILLLIIAVSGTVIVGLLVWKFEFGRRDTSFRSRKRGIGNGIWWATQALFGTTFGAASPQRVWSRLLAVVWMVAGVLLIAMVTAELTAELTVERLEEQIQDVGDLHGKTVITVSGTTSADLLAQNGIDAIQMTSEADAFSAVVNGDADAFVYDSAILRHLVSTSDSGVRITGSVLRSESYGIAVGEGDILVESINRALLRIQENGTYDRLVAAWFG